MVTIRRYCEADAESVGQLIADTYRKFNLSFVPEEELAKFLGPFYYARSPETAHKDAIAETIDADMVWVAEDDGDIIGILRGRADKLQSLFVREDYQRRGVGRDLVTRFEMACFQKGATVIKVQATVYAVPFYQALGYKKTTGVRQMWSFEGHGLPYQPMKKVLSSEKDL